MSAVANDSAVGLPPDYCVSMCFSRFGTFRERKNSYPRIFLGQCIKKGDHIFRRTITDDADFNVPNGLSLHALNGPNGKCSLTKSRYDNRRPCYHKKLLNNIGI